MCVGNCTCLNVSNAQCACGGDGNKATGETARARAARALKIMMRSVDFILMSVGDPWKGLRQGRGSEQFVHYRAGKSEEYCGEMWDVTGRGLPEGYENEAPPSEEKPKEGPSLPGLAA